MTNRLAHETSPYLLQHAENPVDWYPWSAEALDRARREDRPIFLSIGYSACHWCHVMEHESFEDPRIAALLNEHFVSIKVDREERPDLDQIYMNAVQALTGRGGWPMSVFLTGDLEPFYGGTYWPPTARMGMPGFDQVLAAVSNAWRERRDEVRHSAGQLTERLRSIGQMSGAAGDLNTELLDHAVAQLERVFDHRWGGFGGAPKFPHPMDLSLLLRYASRTGHRGAIEVVTHTLDRMAAGGIYDHLGGGFHRYSVDERWLVPHFEKMLYDNALLAGCYVEAFQATGRADYARVARETLDYVLREMTDREGGFYSTQDADSEGEEGRFYVWTPGEIEAVLGADAAALFCRVYDVSEGGNFEGRNVLNLPKTLAQCAAILNRDEQELTAQLAAARARLLEHRGGRVAPALDDKVLVSWNALAIDALARAGTALAEPRYLEAAVRAADFIARALARPDGRLLHTWRRGEARLDAYLDDYAYLANALVTLYEAMYDERWLDRALDLAETMLAHFADGQEGGFYFTADDHEQLIMRQKDVQDASVPSGNSMAATALLRLARLTGRSDLERAAEGTLRSLAQLMRSAPSATGQMLIATDFYLGPTAELAVVASTTEQARPALDELARRFLPRTVRAFRAVTETTHRSKALEGLFVGKEPLDPPPTLYVCRDFACEAPRSGAESIRAALDELSAATAAPPRE